MSQDVFIALGSNLRNPAANILCAMDRLERFSLTPLLRSSLWESRPVDCPPGSPAFVNAAVSLSPLSGESPESLLAKLQAVEREFGRQTKKLLNEPRPLDLDLIAFGTLIRNSSSLTLPHPRAPQRRFVLQPLSEIAPQLILPGQTLTVLHLLDSLARDDSVRRLSLPSHCLQ